MSLVGAERAGQVLFLACRHLRSVPVESAWFWLIPLGKRLVGSERTAASPEPWTTLGDASSAGSVTTGVPSPSSYDQTVPEVGDDESELDFIADLPADWRPPPAAARAILDVMLSVQERRARSTGSDATSH